MANVENLVEAAITGALEKYCNEDGRPQLIQFRPYANQQGNEMRRYCADIVGILDKAKVLLLEIKERDCTSGLLDGFDNDQFLGNSVFETLGVPIAYAYNILPVKDLKYYADDKSGNWAEVALQEIKRSPPSQLPNNNPNANSHKNLLEWLLCGDSGESEDALAHFGRIHGAIGGPEDLRNGMLVLVYSVTRNELVTLTPKQLNQVIASLQNNSSLTPVQQIKLQKIFQESKTVFDSFAKAVSTAPRVPPQRGGGPRKGGPRKRSDKSFF